LLENPKQKSNLKLIPKKRYTNLILDRCLLLATAFFVLALPPLPLIVWVAGDEPFYGPATTSQLAFVSIAFFDVVGWLIVSVTIIVAATCRLISRMWLLSFPVVFFFGGLSALAIECFGSDQRWFG